jgi:hypothetical protein
MTPIFQCIDKNKKCYWLMYDGGSSGKYVIKLCQKCRELENDEFLIREVPL